MSQVKLKNPVYVQGQPVTMRVVYYSLISLFLLFFYFLSVHLLDIYGFALFFVILSIASLLGIEFFTVFFLVDIFMQNILIASVTTYDPNNVPSFSLSLGTGFFITCFFAAYCGISWLKFQHTLPSKNQKLLYWVLLFSFVVIIYSGLGLVSSDAKSVTTYLRVYLGAVMFLVIGIGAGYTVSADFLAATIRIIATTLVIWGISELLFTKELLGFFDILDYTRMKFLGLRPVVENLDALIKPQPYLNLSGQFGLEFKLHPMVGPHIHAISYAYELAFCTLVCFMYNYRLLATACIIILILVGAKGPIVETFAALSFYVVYYRVGRPRVLMFAVLAYAIAYISIVSYYGIVSKDFHMLGLLGSINGFLTNPVGRGVGVGGNMSTEGLNESTLSKFQDYQHQGATPLALESGFGVMLYQLGIATLVFLAFYYFIIRNLWDNVTQNGMDKRKIVLPLALVFILVNSLFQEEAFSPSSIGLWLFFSGFFLIGQWQAEAKVSPHNPLS